MATFTAKSGASVSFKVAHDMDGNIVDRYEAETTAKETVKGLKADITANDALTAISTLYKIGSGMDVTDTSVSPITAVTGKSIEYSVEN